MSEKARAADTPDEDPRKDTADMSLTVDVDADVSAASDAIESLQTDMEALTEELNEAAERVEDIDLSDSAFGDVDYGLPAPSPSDVQERMDSTEADDGEMVPAGPLYELAEMFQSLPVLVWGYKIGKADAGEQLEDKLDVLTGETDE